MQLRTCKAVMDVSYSWWLVILAFSSSNVRTTESVHLACVQGLSKGDTFCDGRSDGLYAYPHSCQCFYQCSNHLTYVMPCAPGNVFFDPDHEPLGCHWPWELSCQRRQLCGFDTSTPCVLPSPGQEMNTSVTTSSVTAVTAGTETTTVTSPESGPTAPATTQQLVASETSMTTSTTAEEGSTTSLTSMTSESTSETQESTETNVFETTTSNVRTPETPSTCPTMTPDTPTSCPGTAGRTPVIARISECHINLRPRCSEADRNSTGSVCLDDISIVSESTSNQCGLHVVAFDVDTCTAVNVTVFDASDRLTVLETDVRRFINGLPLGTALAGHSTCAMQASTASAILSIVGGNGTSLNGDTKFAFVGQTGYRLKTLSMADGCDTSSIQLCVVVSGFAADPSSYLLANAVCNNSCS